MMFIFCYYVSDLQNDHRVNGSSASEFHGIGYNAKKEGNIFVNR